MTAMSNEAMGRARALFEERPTSSGYPTNSNAFRLDLAAYLNHYRRPYRIKITDAGTLHILSDGCLFDQGHKGAGVLQTADGLLLYTCFHDSCQAHTWQEARKIISGDGNLAPFLAGGQKRAEERRPLNKPDPADLSTFLSIGSLLDVEEPE